MSPGSASRAVGYAAMADESGGRYQARAWSTSDAAMAAALAADDRARSTSDAAMAAALAAEDESRARAQARARSASDAAMAAALAADDRAQSTSDAAMAAALAADDESASLRPAATKGGGETAPRPRCSAPHTSSLFFKLYRKDAPPLSTAPKYIGQLVNWARPAQSLRGYTARKIDDQLHGLGKNGCADAGVIACAKYGFKIMLEREQALHGEYIAFYHSYNFAALLYEVQGVLARVAYRLPADAPPLMRLLRAPFNIRPELSMLLEDFKGMAGQDHNPEFRALAVAVSNSLFGGVTEAPPVSFFTSGYGGGEPPPYRRMLAGLLSALGHDSPALVGVLIDIGERYKLPMSAYGAAGTGGGGAASRTPILDAAAAPPPGHMLQIFVHRDWVDTIAYPCQPMGVRIGKGTMLEYYKKHSKKLQGQARLFVHPAVFTDETKAKVFHYAADPDLSCVVDNQDGRMTRLEMLREIAEALQRFGVTVGDDYEASLRERIENGVAPELPQSVGVGIAALGAGARGAGAVSIDGRRAAPGLAARLRSRYPGVDKFRTAGGVVEEGG